MNQNWHHPFPQQKMPTMANFNIIHTTTMNGSSNHHHQPSWVDEFLDFSSDRRGTHRRSISCDSVAFLEQPLVVVDNNECSDDVSSNNNAMIMNETNVLFDRLDDEQLMSMFSDDVTAMNLATTSTAAPTVSSSNPSTPTSDQNSNNDEKPAPSLDLQQPKSEPGEVESSNGDPITDTKRVKR